MAPPRGVAMAPARGPPGMDATPSAIASLSTRPSLASRLPTPGPDYNIGSTLSTIGPKLSTSTRSETDIRLAHEAEKPGPGNYFNSKASTFDGTTTTFKARGETEIDREARRASKLPGPGHYGVTDAPRQNCAIKISTASPMSADDVALKTAGQQPGPGQYASSLQVPRARPRSSIGARSKTSEDLRRDQNLPGPGWYDPAPARSKSSVGFNKSPYTMEETNSKNRAKTPGPGAYDTSIAVALPKGGRVSRTPSKVRTHIEEQSNRAAKFPGPGQYNAVEFKGNGGKLPPHPLDPKHRGKIKIVDSSYLKASDIPGPGHYAQRQSAVNGVHGGKFNMSKPKNYIEEAVYQKAYLPGPSAYDPIVAKGLGSSVLISKSTPPSDVDLSCARASKTPGPGQYVLPPTFSQVSTSMGYSARPGPELATKKNPGPGDYDAQTGRLLRQLGGKIGTGSRATSDVTCSPGPATYTKPSTVKSADLAALSPSDPRKQQAQWNDLVAAASFQSRANHEKTINGLVHEWSQKITCVDTTRTIFHETDHSRSTTPATPQFIAPVGRRASTAQGLYASAESTFLTGVDPNEEEQETSDCEGSVSAEDYGIDCSEPTSFVNSFFPASQGAAKIRALVDNAEVRKEVVEKSRLWTTRGMSRSSGSRCSTADSTAARKQQRAAIRLSEPKTLEDRLAGLDAEIERIENDPTEYVNIRKINSVDTKTLSKWEGTTKSSLKLLNRGIHEIGAELKAIQATGYGGKRHAKSNIDFIRLNAMLARQSTPVVKRASSLAAAFENMDNRESALKKALTTQMESVLETKKKTRMAEDRVEIQRKKEARERKEKADKQASSVMLVLAHMGNFINGCRLALNVRNGHALLARRNERAALLIQFYCMKKYLPDRLKRRQRSATTIVCLARRFLHARRTKVRRVKANVLLVFLEEQYQAGAFSRAMQRFKWRICRFQRGFRDYITWKALVYRDWMAVLDRVMSEPAVTSFSYRENEGATKHRERVKKMRETLVGICRIKPAIPPFDAKSAERLLDPYADLPYATPALLKKRVLDVMWTIVRKRYKEDLRDFKFSTEEHQRHLRHVKLMLMALPDTNKHLSLLPDKVRTQIRDFVPPIYPRLGVQVSDDDMSQGCLGFMQDLAGRAGTIRKQMKARKLAALEGKAAAVPRNSFHHPPTSQPGVQGLKEVGIDIGDPPL